MANRKSGETTPRRRYGRRATKKRAPLRMPAHPGRVLACILAALLVMALALLTGSLLKARSDAYREAEAAGDWTLSEAIATPVPVSVPSLRGLITEPGESMGDILINGIYDGVLLPLYDGTSPLPYTSAVGSEAGYPTVDDAYELSREVERIGGRGLYTVGVFTLTFPTLEDPALRSYRRGFELSLLREYAGSGISDLLLLGLPVGNDTADGVTVEFLNDLQNLLSDIPHRPAIGAALPLSGFEGKAADDFDPETAEALTGSAQYAGALSPGRVRQVCDYLALDLRDYNADSVASLLPSLQYAYVRHSLRLLLPEGGEAVTEALEHGFGRVFELTPPTSNGEDETTP